MPQMAPMNWLTLFILFTMIYLMFNVMNYFSFKYLVKKLPLKSKLTKLIENDN